MQTIFNFEFRFDKNNKNKRGIVVSIEYQVQSTIFIVSLVSLDKLGN